MISLVSYHCFRPRIQAPSGLGLFPRSSKMEWLSLTIAFFSVLCLVGGLTGSAIVGNEVNYLTYLSTWLKPVAKRKSSRWKRCWRASVDGWAASTFHSRCDNKGPTVTIIRVGGKYIFGGYTSLSWGKWKDFLNLSASLRSRRSKGQGRELGFETERGRRGTPANKPLFSPSRLLIKLGIIGA